MNDRIALIVVLLSGRVLQVLEHEQNPSSFFGKTVRIEPATSLFIISHPVCDAIVRK